MRPVFLLIILAVLASIAAAAPQASREVKPAAKKTIKHPGIPHPKNKVRPPPARGSKGKSPAEPALMDPIPVAGESLVPNTLVKASYVADMAPEAGKPADPAVIVAKCQFTSNQPTVNLANVVEIKSIKCDKSAMGITFDSTASAGAAHQAWSKHRDFAVIIPRKWKCEGINEVSFRVVMSATVNANRRNVLMLKTGSVSREDLFTDYDISLTKIKTPGGANAATLAKRGVLSKKTKTRLAEWNFSVNWDPLTNKPKHQAVPFAATPEVIVKCVDCNVRGTAQLSLRVKGNKLGVKSYDLELSGELAGDLGVNVHTYNPFSKPLAELTLLTVPLSPVSVPGILSVGPELRLTASVTVSVEGKLRINSGATINSAFNWHVSSTNGLMAKPTKAATAKPSVKVHPLMIEGEAMASVEGHLSPSFNLALSVFKWTAFDLSFGWDSAIGVGVSLNGSASVKKDGINGGVKGELTGELTADVYHRHSVALGVKTKGLGEWNFPLWESGKNVIPRASIDLTSWDKTISNDEPAQPGQPGQPAQPVKPAQPDATAPVAAALVAWRSQG